ncbi:hypothetical protein LCGC14_2582070, partial [marine sediment metagenome]
LHVEGRDTSSIFYLYLCLQHEASLVSTSFCFSFPQQASSAVLQSKERQFKSPNFRVKKNYEFVAFLILIVFHENPAIKRQYLVCFSPMLKGGIVNRLRRNWSSFLISVSAQPVRYLKQRSWFRSRCNRKYVKIYHCYEFKTKLQLRSQSWRKRDNLEQEFYFVFYSVLCWSYFWNTSCHYHCFNFKEDNYHQLVFWLLLLLLLLLLSSLGISHFWIVLSLSSQKWST